MADADYIAGKLRELAARGEIDILQAMVRKQSEATLAGALGDARCLLFLQETLREGFRASLERMARVVVGMNAETSEPVIAGWTEIARSLGEALVEKKTNALFGNPAFDRQANSRAKHEKPKFLIQLEDLRERIIADARNRVVGHDVVPASAGRQSIADAVPGLLHAMEKLKLTEADTARLSSLSHQDLIEIVKAFVAEHAEREGIAGTSTTTQGLSDSGTDAIARCLDGKHRLNIGFQVKSNGEIKKSGKDSLQRTVNAQITESKKQRLDHLLVMLAGDMTDRSVNAKCRAILSNLHGDDYVIVIEPETMAGLAAWMEKTRGRKG